MPIKWRGRAEKHETFLVCETPGLLHDHPVIILGDLGCVSQITPKGKSHLSTPGGSILLPMWPTLSTRAISLCRYVLCYLLH